MSLNLHSTLSVVFPIFGDFLSFVALHSKFLPLSVLFPVRVMKVVFLPALLVMSVDPMYQEMVGVGSASLLTTHWITLWMPSLTVSGLSLGIKEIL